MAIDIDIAAYESKIVICERMLVEKRELLARTTDMQLRETLERSIVTLGEMLQIYGKITHNLRQIRRLDARQNKRDQVSADPE